MSKKTVKRTKAYFGKRHITVSDSKLINKVFYDPETGTLDAVIKAGGRYRYHRVPAKVFAKFVLASSLGNFFNRNIKSKYVVEKAR
jgi:hypothetical protein